LYREGTLPQKTLFLVGTAGLGVIAYANDEEMLTALQAIITLGAVLAFVLAVPLWSKLVVLCGAAAVSIGWLVYSTT